jgi:LysM repeat protein
MKKIKILLKLLFLFNTLYIYSDYQLMFDNVVKERTQEAVFLNPAMLDIVKSPEICLTYNMLYPKLTDETKFVNNNICFVKELYGGGVGLGYVQFGIKDWYIKDMFFISYGHELKPYMEKLSLGLKFVYTKEEYSLDDYIKQNPVFKIGNSVGYFSLNLAAKYSLDTNNVLSLVVENLNQPNTAINTTDVLPLKLNFGYKYKYKKLNIMPKLKTEFSVLTDYIFGLTTEYEFLFFNNKIKFVPTLSIEYGSREYNKILAGFEIKTAQVSIIYGYSLSPTSKIDTGGSQYISLGYKFIPQPVEEEKVSKKEYEKLLLEKQQLEQQIEQIRKYAIIKPSEEKPKAEEVKPQTTTETVQPQLTTEEILLKKLQELEQKLKEVETKKVEEKPKPPAVVSPTTTTTPTAAKPVKRYHTVVAGDTLPKLAEKYYGDASQWRKIYEVNKDKIIRGQLTPGTVLEIP